MPKHIPAIVAGPQPELLSGSCRSDIVVAYFEEQGIPGVGLLLWGSVEVLLDEGPVEFGGTKYMVIQSYRDRLPFGESAVSECHLIIVLRLRLGSRSNARKASGTRLASEGAPFMLGYKATFAPLRFFLPVPLLQASLFNFRTPFQTGMYFNSRKEFYFLPPIRKAPQRSQFVESCSNLPKQ